VTPGGPLHPGDENLPPDAYNTPSKPKVKRAEAAGGLAGGILGQVAGTAVGGPVGGIAASLVGDKLGSGVVRMGKKMFGRGKKPAEEAAAAPAEARPAAATEPAPEPALAALPPQERDRRPTDAPS
jgi:predicted lipid-binding transport protein (Tim44 family)